MKKPEFEKQYAWIVEEVRELRETQYYDDDRIRCFLIGIVTAETGSNYTNSQLKKIFDLEFTRQRKQEEKSR